MGNRRVGRKAFERGVSLGVKENQEKREIIFAWEFWEWGGGQIYFLGIMREAVARGYRVKAVMPAGSSEKLIGYLKKEEVEIEFFPARIDLSPAKNVWHKIRRRFRDARCHFVLAQHLAKQGLRGKIIQLEAAPWSAFTLFYYLARRTNVFLTMHIALPFSPESPLGRIARLKYRLLCRLPNFHLLASNRDMKQSLREFVPEKSWREIPVAYTGVNTTEIKTALNLPLERGKMLEKFDLPAGKIFVFSLGNIIERKGFRVFLEAAKILTKTREDLFFIWVGDGESRETMQNLIRDFGLENTVKIIRPADFGGERQELLQLLRFADIYVHPSFAEGLPGAMLEAMALGKPTIASRVNAIPECVIDGENGFLIKAGDANGFAEAIEKLTDDAKMRENFGQNARERVLTNFTEERCAEITINFYEKHVEGKRQKAKGKRQK